MTHFLPHARLRPSLRALSPTLLACLLLVPLASTAHGQGASTAERSDARSSPQSGSKPTGVGSGSESESPREKRSITRGSVTIDGRAIEYTATVGDLLIRDDDDQPTASMTYVSYVRDGVEDRSSRPVTFAFNGGPGSASVWVHLGAFGPKRVALDAEGMPLGPPPAKLVNNEFSVLDATDLVFVDPVGTGWSRPLDGHELDEFTGYTSDVMHVGEMIRLWLSREGRWASPKFIAGESYGTTRAAGLAEYLQGAHGMALNGLFLISSVINWQTKVFNIGNDLPYPLILPTYTATAWFHGKLPERYADDLQLALREAEAFALGPYATALMQGSRLEGEARRQIRDRLAELTGLDPAFVERADLRVELYRFLKELLREEGVTVGRLDSRYTGRDIDSAGESFEFDPSFKVIGGHYVATLEDYLRRELGYETDTRYRQSAGARVRPWNYHESSRTSGYNTNAYANYAETLRSSMHRNPYLKVLVASGYYDMATPYFATDYTFDHMQLAPEFAGNIRHEYYEAGHMMYVRTEDHRKFRLDFLRLIEDALAEVPMPGGM